MRSFWLSVTVIAGVLLLIGLRVEGSKRAARNGPVAVVGEPKTTAIVGYGETKDGARREALRLTQEWVEGELRGQLSGYYRVGSVTNVDQMVEAVRSFQDRVWIDGLEATVEAHTMPAAQATFNTRTPRGAPTARSCRISTAQAYTENETCSEGKALPAASVFFRKRSAG